MSNVALFNNMPQTLQLPKIHVYQQELRPLP